MRLVLPVPPSEFWTRFEPKPTGCWEYTGYRREDGYGEFAPKRGVKIRAHRYAYELLNGPIPDGLFVCHRCDNPPCCNPAHLFLGTHEDNQADKVAKDRASNANKGKTHCKRGHPLSGENLYVNKRGLRSCRECERARSRRWYTENAEAQRARCRAYHPRRKRT